MSLFGCIGSYSPKRPSYPQTRRLRKSFSSGLPSSNLLKNWGGWNPLDLERISESATPGDTSSTCLNKMAHPVSVFYESGKSNGRSAAVAVARVTSTVVVPKSQITATLIDGGVVAEEDIKDLSSGILIAATTVDNVMKLRKPVALKRLREFGCVDGSNLITSRQITSDQLQQIITEGQGIRE